MSEIKVDPIVVAASLDAAAKMLRPERMLSYQARPKHFSISEWRQRVTTNRTLHNAATRLSNKARDIRYAALDKEEV